jgi:uncharacterized protein YjbI with pentapeptide repeats
VIALGTGWITWQLANLENQRAQQAQKVENQRAEAERELAEQRAQDEALQAYLDQMSGLLLEKDLRTSEEDSEVRTLAQARTLTVLERLDPSRKTAVVQFLVEAKLVQRVARTGPIISLNGDNLSGAYLFSSALSGADLERADLGQANLSDADLRGTNLSDAVLIDADFSTVEKVCDSTQTITADLPKADLSKATLLGADLSGCLLKEATLTDASLQSANVRSADLQGADLSHADLPNADLSPATVPGFPRVLPKTPTNLSDADLSWADLREADLTGAVLSGADLSGADLDGARGVTNRELEQQASLLSRTTMPHGQRYEDWLKSKRQEENGKNGGSP